jgi:hypothetical protein
MSRRHGSDLYPQALRLPQHARDRLVRLAVHLGASGPQVKVAQATRGLCLLALDLARGTAGSELAAAVRVAASDPAQASVRNALGAIVILLDSVASTMPVRSEPAANQTRTAGRPSMPRGSRSAARVLVPLGPETMVFARWRGDEPAARAWTFPA